MPLILQGDARRLPDSIADGSVQCVVTSPPYPKQRLYGDDPDEIGQGTTFEQYVDEIAEVADGLLAKLREDGTLWLNIGHKSTQSGGAGGDYGRGGEKEGKPKYGKFSDPSYAPRQIMDVSNMVGTALQTRGWRWVTSIVWSKITEKDGVERPVLERQDENHIRRPRLSHEMILMLCPASGRQKYHADPTVEQGTVWHMKPGSSLGTGHIAPFPVELPRRCILLSTDPGDLVLDPFGGEHTTALTADALDRQGISIDLYEGATPAPVTTGS